MVLQARGWMDDEQEAVDSGRAGISYVRQYGFAHDVLEGCSEKLRRVENII
jgi:hypothetical protein